MIQNSLEYI